MDIKQLIESEIPEFLKRRLPKEFTKNAGQETVNTITSLTELEVGIPGYYPFGDYQKFRVITASIHAKQLKSVATHLWGRKYSILKLESLDKILVIRTK